MQRPVEEVEVNVLYAMSWAMDRILMDIENRLNSKGEIFLREKKRAFKNLIDAINRAYRASSILQEDIERSSAKSGYKELDSWANEVNQMCRLLLLWSDRCETEDDSNEVFKLLRSFKGEGVITEADLDRFYLKK